MSGAYPPLVKPYNLSIEQRTGYLLARVSGYSASLETSRKYWNEIALETAGHNAKRLMVWEDFAGMISTQDTLTLVKEISRLPQFLTVRMVVLDEYPDQFDRNKLGEMIANNHGLTCRVFSNFDEAEAWLLSA